MVKNIQISKIYQTLLVKGQFDKNIQISKIYQTLLVS